MTDRPSLQPPEGDDWLVLTEAVLPSARALEWVEGERWGGVVGFFGVVRDHAEGRVVLWHRTGRLEVGETSVAVVVSAPHRGEAFDACRFLIDTLKATLPIWKLEHWPDGSGWSPSAHAVEEIEHS